MSHPIKATPSTSACPSAETQRSRANTSRLTRAVQQDRRSAAKMLFVVNLVNYNNHNKDPNSSDLMSQGEGGRCLAWKMTVTLTSDGKWVTGLYMTHTRVSPCRVMGQSGMRCQLSASDLTASEVARAGPLRSSPQPTLLTQDAACEEPRGSRSHMSSAGRRSCPLGLTASLHCLLFFLLQTQILDANFSECSVYLLHRFLAFYNGSYAHL